MRGPALISAEGETKRREEGWSWVPGLVGWIRYVIEFIHTVAVLPSLMGSVMVSYNQQRKFEMETQGKQ